MPHELFANPETFFNLHHKPIETTNNTPNSPMKKANNPTRTLMKVFAEEKINLTPIAEPSKTTKTDDTNRRSIMVEGPQFMTCLIEELAVGAKLAPFIPRVRTKGRYSLCAQNWRPLNLDHRRPQFAAHIPRS